MDRFFDIISGKVVINSDILGIPQFKKIWNRDKSKNKDKATNEITYIVFLSHFKSPYRDYPYYQKEEKIKQDIFDDKDWEPDELIKAAIQQYEDLQQTTNLRLLKSAKVAAEKLADYFETIDLKAVGDDGKYLYSASDITRNLKEIGNIVKSLNALDKQVRIEQEEASSIRGGGEIGDYELADDLDS